MKNDHQGYSPYALSVTRNDELAPQYVQSHRETDHRPGILPIHSHPFFELAYVRSCQQTEYVVGEKTYRLQTGDILFIPPEVSHGAVLSAIPGEPCIRDTIWISSLFLNRMDQMHPNRRVYTIGDAHFLRTAGTDWSGLGALFGTCVAEQEHHLPGWEAMVAGTAMQILAQIFRAMVDRSQMILQEDKPELLFRVTDYMESHLGEKLTLESLSREFDVSKSTITQMFRKQMDTSFYAWLTLRRLTHAKGLIAQGVPLEQVGKLMGFREHSAFYRAFKQEFGLSPREYRINVGAEKK